MDDARRSALTGWVLAIVRAMQVRGIDADAVLAEIGMDASRLEGGYSRYSQDQLSQLWKRAATLTGDPCFGLRVAEQVRPSSFHVVGYLMMCSSNLLRSLQRFTRFTRLISDSATAGLVETSGQVIVEFHFDTGGEPPIYQTVDTVLASVVNLLRWIAQDELPLAKVCFSHASTDAQDEFAQFFGCPISYDAPRTRLTFEKADLLRPIMSSDEELASMLESAAQRFLEQRMAGRFAIRVRDLMIAQLPDEVPTKARTAKLLGMTERTLLRRLKDEGTTFAEVLKQLREELAFRYLRRGLGLSEVAYLLGFSDNGTFSRAFKDWTGRRPSTVTNEFAGAG